ncbi:hypothetical protein [Planctomicrobium piriforme]|uniref:Uncharacterized protein n=1 Tax=Planctomicrobium piriforme TaxID=1576369 RepID=A0A1I3IIA4_9PLAN|nr:hypothetical protein [Planctomicrobium piriforme]SFI47666.1 hypothetical protein SAMN05421753_109135 [Planctomicrobium piriforme]
MFLASTRLSFFSRFVLFAVGMCSALSAMPAVADANVPPVITFFDYVIPMDDYFIFYGMVDDEDPASCTILFGGPLEGGYTSVNEDGSFMLCLSWDPGDLRSVTATAYDSLYQASYATKTWGVE